MRKIGRLRCTSRNYSYKDIDDECIQNFIEWLEKNFDMGVNGEPCDWDRFRLPKLDIYEE